MLSCTWIFNLINAAQLFSIMEKEWSTDELKQIAQQLGKPDGPSGIATAERMAENNGGMTARTIQVMDVSEHDNILEIGPGNAAHLHLLFDLLTTGHYVGVDIAPTMIQEAERINSALVKSQQASFELTDGEHLPFEDGTFDKIFTVNTLYFWKDPVKYPVEIYRVLKPGGVLVMTITDKSFMEKLPFTQYGFQLYDRVASTEVLTQAGFVIDSVSEEVDSTTGMLGQTVERDILIIKAVKS